MKNHTIRIIMKKKMANERNEERKKEIARDYIEYSSAYMLYVCTFAVCVSQHQQWSTIFSM